MTAVLISPDPNAEIPTPVPQHSLLLRARVRHSLSLRVRVLGAGLFMLKYIERWASVMPQFDKKRCIVLVDYTDCTNYIDYTDYTDCTDCTGAGGVNRFE